MIFFFVLQRYKKAVKEDKGMKKALLFFIIVMVLGWIGHAPAAEPNLKEGMWEMTFKSEIKGMPMQMPATTVRQCITKKDAVPQQKPEQGQECKMTSTKVTGDTISWTMRCVSKDATVDSDGKVTYKGNSSEGVSNTTVKQKGQQPMHMTSSWSGKWIGPCK